MSEENLVLDFSEIRNEIIATLAKNRNISLATSLEDRVTTRNVQYINVDLDIYFTSWGFNKKIKQIEGNPNVALHQMGIQIEGVAEVLRWPLDEKTKKVEEKFAAKYKWFSKLSGQREAVMVKITPKKLVIFKTIDGVFHLQNIDLGKKKVYQMKLRDKENPNYPY
ncbi:MAG: pyridoxamine 5'-phosphate oxidase family protein [Candidatus Heimdallarchaeota archaeon]|nr:pyridoxamine 5'-phosphate oxidase family protein [Candidatus Heimdallarchaeota archaeon]